MLQINLFSAAYNYVFNTRVRCLQECIKLAQHATAIFKHSSWMLISEYGRETAWSWEVVFVGSQDTVKQQIMASILPCHNLCTVVDNSKLPSA